MCAVEDTLGRGGVDTVEQVPRIISNTSETFGGDGVVLPRGASEFLGRV